MSSVVMVMAQYLAKAAGGSLSPQGRFQLGEDTLLEVAVDNGRISAAAHYQILGIIAERVPDRATFSIRYARSFDIDKLGTIGLAAKAAPNVGGVLQRLARYYTLLTDSATYHLEDRDAGAFLKLTLLAEEGPGAVFSPEAGLSVVFHLLRQMAASPIAPDLVTFRHQAPRDAHHFETAFGCPVRFGEKFDGIVFSQACLETPNKLGDHALSAFLTKHLDGELAEIEGSNGLVRTTKDEIARALSEGLPKMADIARGLGYSVRSFHRRLADHGVSFQTLTEETRREIAVGMLQDNAHSLAEIAFLTGFSEQSAFNRAFKRWTGLTPASYRKTGGAT